MTAFKTLFEEYVTNEERLMGFTDNITAHAGGGAGNLILTSKFNILTTVASDNDSADLPLAKIGMRCFVLNKGAHVAEIYPNALDSINGGSVTSIFIAPTECAILECAYDQDWIIVDTGSLSGIVLTAQITLTKAQILALSATPIEIVAAPPSGFALEVISSCTKFTFSGVAYNGGGDTGVYSDTGTVPQSQSYSSFDSAVSYFNKDSISGGEIIEGKKLVFWCNTTPYTDAGGSNGTAKVYITYRIITL